MIKFEEWIKINEDATTPLGEIQPETEEMEDLHLSGMLKNKLNIFLAQLEKSNVPRQKAVQLLAKITQSMLGNQSVQLNTQGTRQATRMALNSQ